MTSTVFNKNYTAVGEICLFMFLLIRWAVIVQKIKNHHYIYLLNYRVRMRDLKENHKICKDSKDFSVYSNTN